MDKKKKKKSKWAQLGILEDSNIQSLEKYMGKLGGKFWKGKQDCRAKPWLGLEVGDSEKREQRKEASLADTGESRVQRGFHCNQAASSICFHQIESLSYKYEKDRL